MSESDIINKLEQINESIVDITNYIRNSNRLNGNGNSNGDNNVNKFEFNNNYKKRRTITDILFFDIFSIFRKK